MNAELWMGWRLGLRRVEARLVCCRYATRVQPREWLESTNSNGSVEELGIVS